MNPSEFRRNTANLSDAAIDMLRDRLKDMVQQLDAIQAGRNNDVDEDAVLEISVPKECNCDSKTCAMPTLNTTSAPTSNNYGASSHVGNAMTMEYTTRRTSSRRMRFEREPEGDEGKEKVERKRSSCRRPRDQLDGSSLSFASLPPLSPPPKRSRSDEAIELEKSKSRLSRVIGSKQEHHYLAHSMEVDQTIQSKSDTAMVRDSCTASIPTEVLRQLIRSSFLEPVDLGRLLLRTSKSIKDVIGNEYMYYHLCRNRWKNTKKIPASVTKARGHDWLFKNLNKGLVKTRPQREYQWPTLAPPKLTPSNLVLLLNVWNGKQEVVSEALKTDSLSELFRTGKVVAELEQPIVVGEFTMENNVIKHTPTEFDNWNATMQLVRLDTNQSCCVHESSDTWWYYDGDLTKKVGNLHLSPDLTGLELNENGKALECRIREHDRMMDHQSFEGIYFEATMICSTYASESNGTSGASVADTDSSSASAAAAPLASMKFAFTKVKMEIYSIYEFAGDVFNSESEAQAHGVSALHLLDELRGWDESS